MLSFWNRWKGSSSNLHYFLGPSKFFLLFLYFPWCSFVNIIKNISIHFSCSRIRSSLIYNVLSIRNNIKARKIELSLLFNSFNSVMFNHPVKNWWLYSFNELWICCCSQAFEEALKHSLNFLLLKFECVIFDKTSMHFFNMNVSYLKDQS